MEKNFGIYVNGCFHITFKNGVTVSSTMGVGTYCENRNIDGEYDYLSTHSELQSNSAEICIWDKDGNYLTHKWKDDGDDTVGWQSPEQLLEALNWASKYIGG